MGYRVAESRETVVTHLIGPGPRAIFKEDSFTPDVDFQQAEIDRLYQGSGRKDTFLGDWHTHPRSTPSLSLTDHAAIRAIAGDPLSRQPNPIMAILAGGDPWRLMAWRYNRMEHLSERCIPMVLRRF
jgi:integrative and conjugative element protein (TIGR02256 family)